MFLAVGKWSPSVKDVGADLVPPLDLCIRTRYRNVLSHFNWMLKAMFVIVVTLTDVVFTLEHLWMHFLFICRWNDAHVNWNDTEPILWHYITTCFVNISFFFYTHILNIVTVLTLEAVSYWFITVGPDQDFGFQLIQQSCVGKKKKAKMSFLFSFALKILSSRHECTC